MCLVETDAQICGQPLHVPWCNICLQKELTPTSTASLVGEVCTSSHFVSYSLRLYSSSFKCFEEMVYISVIYYIMVLKLKCFLSWNNITTHLHKLFLPKSSNATLRHLISRAMLHKWRSTMHGVNMKLGKYDKCLRPINQPVCICSNQYRVKKRILGGDESERLMRWGRR